MTAFDGLPDAVVVLDAERRIVDCNEALARLLGRSALELIGQSFVTVARPRTLTEQPLLTQGWHRSTKLRSVHRIPEQEAIVGRSHRVRVTGRYHRNPDGSVVDVVLAFRPAGRTRNEPSGVE
ncbi:MAG: PAS domain-containing protein, partial [Acidimicrobiales bacterium]